MTLIKSIFLKLSIFIIASCSASNFENDSKLHALEIVNQTWDDIYNVSISIPKTQQGVTCEVIKYENDCFFSFPPREKQDNKVVISWEQKQKIYRKELLVDQYFYPMYDNYMIASVYIMNDGRTETFVREDNEDKNLID